MPAPTPGAKSMSGALPAQPDTSGQAAPPPPPAAGPSAVEWKDRIYWWVTGSDYEVDGGGAHIKSYNDGQFGPSKRHTDGKYYVSVPHPMIQGVKKHKNGNPRRVIREGNTWRAAPGSSSAGSGG